jgi:hypothetical protein
MASVNVNIDIEDIVWDLSTREQKELLELICDELGVPSPLVTATSGKNGMTINEEEHIKICNHLAGNYLRISPEDHEKLNEIYKKY